MFGALTSLTGGGGLTGGAATATNGDTSFGGKAYGGVNFSSPEKSSGLSVSPIVAIGAVVVVALFVLKK